MMSFPGRGGKIESRRSVTNRTRVNGTSRFERSIVVKKGGLAKIRIISTTPELRGELRWLLTPRIIKSLFEDSNTVETPDRKRKTRRLKKYCKNICKLYKLRRNNASPSYYDLGCKRCVECEVFLKYDGMRCPCCDRILRIKPHNNISKGKFLQTVHYIYKLTTRNRFTINK